MMRRKLKSENGASLALALLFFVICAMVGSVVLAAATAAAGRVNKTLREADQRKYALESAANLLVNNITSVKYTRTIRTGVTGADTDKIDDTAIKSKCDQVLAALKNQCHTLNDMRLTRTDSNGVLLYGLDFPQITDKVIGENWEIDKSVDETPNVDGHRATFKIDTNITEPSVMGEPVRVCMEMAPDYSIKLTCYYENLALPRLMVLIPAVATESVDNDYEAAGQADAEKGLEGAGIVQSVEVTWEHASMNMNEAV